MSGSGDDITLVSHAVEKGEKGENSSDRLLPMAYQELRKLAYARISNER